MATLVEPGYFGSEAGTADRVYAWRLRQLLRDLPVSANEQANGDGVTTLFQMQKVPIYDDQNTIVVMSGNTVPIVRSRDLLTGANVYVDFDNGMVLFGQGNAPPAASNNVAIQKTRVRWTDGVLIDALNGGLRQLFPRLFKRGVDTSITLQVNQWDYTLSNAFFDSRTQIISVSVQEVPSSVNRPVPISGWTQRGLNTIDIPTSQRYTPGATVWIEYRGPFRSLAELDPQMKDLPLYYAAGQLLGFDEARRTRADTQSPAAESSANPPMYQQNAGSWFMNQFNAMLAANPMRPMMMPRAISSYER
jgi:hypothetical protein